MDELEKRLKEDAARIEARVSPELERRIEASLRALGRPRRPRRPSLWLASSLSGAVAAAIVIAAVNLRSAEEPPRGFTTPAFGLPAVDLKTEAAMLTAPLDRELESLRSDLEKARQAVREDVEEVL